MRRTSTVICCFLSCALAAQEIPSSAVAKLAILQGIVVKEPGSEPVKKALIELIAESQKDAGNYTALSGSDGSFRIENIAPGSYRLFAERTGYQEVIKRHQRSEGRVIVLSAGQELKDIIIRLQAAAVIEGRVTDEDGDPMADAQVAAFRQTFVGGHMHWEQIGAERTNDLGEYRIAALASGQYFISVTPPPDFRSLIETGGNKQAGTPADKPANYSYQTTYYPGTRDRGQASPILLHPGDDFPANFSLLRGPSFSIRGAITNLLPGTSAAITLQSRDFNVVMNGAEVRKDGTFEIRDVSPGAYTIIATVDNAASPMMARQSLQVTENIEGIRLNPQFGAAIRGQVRFDQGPGVRTAPSQIFLQLRPAEDSDDAPTSLGLDLTPTQVNSDGSFEWKDVMPGRYFVQLTEGAANADWYLKAATAGTREVSESGLTESGGVTALNLVIDMNGASIEGVAADASGEPVADAVVVAVPGPRFRRLPDRYRKASADQTGHFRLRGLPPGNYTIFAWENIEGEAYLDSGFIRNYEGQGKAVHVTEGERVSLQVKVIPESESE